MLIEINILKFGPIRQKLRICSPFMRSFRIPSDRKSDNMDSDPKYFRNSRLVCLVGDNGGGKTIVLSALKYLFTLMTEGTATASRLLPASTMVSENEKSMAISLVFLAGYVKYNYLIFVKGDVIVEERLFYIPHVRKTLLYQRKIDENGVTEITWGDSLRMTPNEKSNLRAMLSKDKTLLYSYSNLTFHKPALDVAWMYMSRQFFNPSLISLPVITAKDFVESHAELQKVLEEMAEKGIVGTEFAVDFLESMKHEAIVCSSLCNSDDVQFRQHLGRYMRMLSSGEAEFLLCLLLLVRANNNHGVCVIDDFADKMDVKKAMALLDYFLSKNSSSQFVFSTHNTTLLDYESLKREQVVFIYREEDGSISADQKLAKSLHKYISLANAYDRGLRPSPENKPKNITDKDDTHSLNKQ